MKNLYVLFVILFMSQLLTAQIIYVDRNATGANNGTSWTDAYRGLQGAMNAAPAGSEVRVAAGRYVPTTRQQSVLDPAVVNTSLFEPESDRLRSFALNKDILLKGSYIAGTDIQDYTNPTVLSGDLSNNDVVTGRGGSLRITDNEENAFHIFITANLTNAAQIDGFVFQNGYAAFSRRDIVYSGKTYLRSCGAALYNIDSSPRITNVVFEKNEAMTAAGIYNQSSSPVIVNAIFNKNLGNREGLAIHNMASSPTIVNTTIVNNRYISTNGLFTSEIVSNRDNSSTTITNSIIWNNIGVTLDIRNTGGSTATVTFTRTPPNSAYASGAGIFNGVDPLFINVDNDFRLQLNSPLKDVGDNSAVPTGITTDVLGSLRIFDGTVDLGAHEATPCDFITNNRIYVDSSNTSGSTIGTSWATAIPDLQTALTFAKDCRNVQEIWVAGGTYYPTSGTDRSASFELLDDIAIYGGFQGNETSLSQRDVLVNPTVLSGEIGTTSATDNTYQVVRSIGNSNTAVLDGFIIENGYASVSPNNNGGGYYGDDSSPIIRNTTFRNNRARNGGAVAQYNGGSPEFINCIFHDNSTLNVSFASGGAAFIYEGTPLFINSLFYNNTASIAGAINGNVNANITIINSTFYGNSASSIAAIRASNVAITNCIVWGNTANIGATQILRDLNVTHSIVQGGYTGTGNLNQDPLFVNTALRDFRLQLASPGIDAGLNSALPAGITTDFNGDTRIFNSTVDLGAYENQGVRPARRFYVNGTATGANNGTTWANAFTELQDAIDGATANDEIWVAAGTYLPTQDHTGSSTPADNKNKSFYWSKDLKIYGGFAGTEVSISQRDWNVNKTILSGDFNNDDVVTGSGATLTFSNNTENAHNVLITENLTNDALIDGFIITKGRATGGNVIYQTRTFNKSNGAGMYNLTSSPTIANTTISYNNASLVGAGMYNNNGASPILKNVVIAYNATFRGAGMYNNTASSPVITNTIFLGNRSADPGAGMYNFACSPIITNSSFLNNSTSATGGAMYNLSSGTNIKNTIFWDNLRMGRSDLSGADIFSNSVSNVTISNSLTQENSPNSSGPGIINNQDPLFMDAANEDFTLQPCSPLINQGASVSHTTDFTGNPHLTTVDIGPYEYQRVSGYTDHIYVDIDATGNNDGSSWANAYTDLQDAIDNHCETLDIWVAEGTYLPTKDITGNVTPTDARERNFHIASNMNIYGGFNGSETLLSERDWEANETILSGDFNDDDVVTGSGRSLVFSNNTENAYHVLITANLSAASTIDGFTITNGNSSESSGNFTFNSRLFINSGGAGMQNSSSSPTIINTTFEKNYAGNSGGGMHNRSAAPVITNVTFKNNYANGSSGGGGGGLNNDNSANLIAITNTTFDNNYGRKGGGIYNEDVSIEINNVVFNNNDAVSGGGLNSSGTSFSITNSSFIANNATTGGGAIANTLSNGSSITNSVFSNNSSDSIGGAIRNVTSNYMITNTTFVNNAATTAGGAIHNSNSSPVITNTIFWDNTQNAMSNIAGADVFNSNGSSTPTVTYSLTQANSLYSTGTGIINNDLPDFIDIANGDYRLTGCSPMVDMGTAVAHTTDILGNAHLATPDMGAYEYLGVTYNYTNVIYVDVNATGNNDGSSWANAYTALQDAIDNQCGNFDIWVAAGTYLPTKDHTGNSTPIDNRDKKFHIKMDMKLYGGFNGTETMLSERVLSLNTTILSGDFNRDDRIINPFGTYTNPLNNGENAYNVLITTNLTEAAIIDGFTIKGGHASASDSFSYGSQLFDRYQGAGMNNISSSPTLINNTFIHNFTGIADHTQFSGGAMYNRLSEPTIVNCVFADNKSRAGGAMLNLSSSPTITNTTFFNNKALTGGAMYNTSDSDPIITNTIFWKNLRNGLGIAGGDSDGHGADIWAAGSSQTSISFSFVQVPVYYRNNIGIFSNLNPLFVDPLNGDFRLDGCSALLNVGAAVTHTTDILGNPHIGAVDLGAYEFQGALFTDVIYVNKNATGNNDGTSWTDAFEDLQDAIDSHCGNLDIWVAAGTYLPTKDHLGSSTTADNRDKSFYLSKSIKIYGGFNGTETMLSQRDGTTNLTVLSGDFNNDDLITGSGNTLSFTNSEENAYHVLVIAYPFGTSQKYSLDGFIITQGNANGSGSITYNDTTIDRSQGGGLYDIFSIDGTRINDVIFRNNQGVNGAGLYLRNSATLITNTTVRNNRASDSGGGLYLDEYRGIIRNTTVSNNYAMSRGGGLYTDGGFPKIESSMISENYAVSGGGTFSSLGRPNATNTTFANNHASVHGGAMFNTFIQDATQMTNLIFENNTAVSNGGAMYNTGASHTIESNRFTNNNAVLGGAIYNNSNAPDIRSVLFENNTASANGGAIYNNNSTPWNMNLVLVDNQAVLGGAIYNKNTDADIFNSTFVRNAVVTNGGAIYNDTSNATIQNSIFSDNTLNTDNNVPGADVFNSSSTPVVSYSMTQENSVHSTGSGMINNQNPNFIDPINGNFRLALGSRAIGTGWPDDINFMENFYDFDGNRRVVGSLIEIDMGAFENQNNNRSCTSTTRYTTTGWDNGLPDATKLVIFEDDYTTSASGSFNACGLIVNSGTTLDLGDATITVSGDVINNGTLVSPNAILKLDSNQEQRVNGYDFEIGDLVIDNSTTEGVALKSNLDVMKRLDLIDGTLHTGAGRLTLKSNATNTAMVDVVGTGRVNGNVTVERFIPGKRAYRFVSSAVNTSTSIKDNWQEGGAKPIDADYEAGYGTHITGSTTGSNGFDATALGNASIFGYDNVNQNWTTVANTDVTTLTAGAPYRLFVRGSRAVDLTTNTPIPDPTVLRAKGTLVTGDVTVNNLGSNAGEFNFIGNPYQASVDMNAVLAASTNINTSFYYVWDPQLGDRGAYATVILPAGSNTSGSAANRYLQPGQAAFTTTLTTAPASLLFQETHKAVGQITTTFSTPSNPSFIVGQLFRKQNGVVASSLQDSFGIFFSATANNAIDAYDATKLFNQDESIAIKYGSDLLAVDNRQLPASSETIQLNLTRYRTDSYQYKIEINAVAGRQIFLEDTYLGTSTLLHDGLNFYDFTIDSSNSSSNVDRFSFRFENQTLGLDDNELYGNIQLVPNPVVADVAEIVVNGFVLDQNSRAVIYNLAGQKLIENQLNVTSGVAQISGLSKLATGAYLVTITSGDLTQTIKFLKK